MTRSLDEAPVNTGLNNQFELTPNLVLVFWTFGGLAEMAGAWKVRTGR